MIKFILLLTLWTTDGPPIVDVLASGLTGEECIVGMIEYDSTHDASEGIVSCEIQGGGGI